MGSIYASSIIVPAIRRDKRLAATSGSFTFSGSTDTVVVNNVTNVSTVAAPKMTFGFIASAAPSITSFDSLWATTFGQLPNIRLWTVDGAGNFQERSEKPKIIMSGGLIDSIVYDLALPETCYIILSQ